MTNTMSFNDLLDTTLRERVAISEPRGMAQRLTAHLAHLEVASTSASTANTLAATQQRTTSIVVEPQRGKARLQPCQYGDPVEGASAPGVPFHGIIRSSNATPVRESRSLWFALTAHAALLLLVFGVMRSGIRLTKPLTVAKYEELRVPPSAPPRPTLAGGGGGAHDNAPATHGHLPKISQQQILPPKAPPTIAPKLAVQPSIVADLKMADNTMPNMGSPTSALKGLSLGNGSGGGIGSGNGNGVGPGSGGNTGGGMYHVGGGVSAPELLHDVDPEYSEEARKAKFSGNVEVYLLIDPQGNPSHVRCARDIGMGLCEKAIQAVRQYKFKPSMRDGKPVTVDMYIDVNFQIF